METKGRFYTKPLAEAGLFLKHTLQMRLDHPEIEAERLEEEAKARHKIDELHKNYEALQASASANKTTKVEETVREIKNISRSEYYSFTASAHSAPSRIKPRAKFTLHPPSLTCVLLASFSCAAGVFRP